MPKASFAVKDMYQGGGGSQFGFGKSGKFEITGAKSVIREFGSLRAVCVSLEARKLKEDWTLNEDDDTVREQDFTAELWNNNPEYGDIGFRARPGVTASADSPDATDQGSEVGAEGNCLYSDDTEFKISPKYSWSLFIKSLEKHNFKPEVNAQGFLPAYIGMKFESVGVPDESRAVKNPKFPPTRPEVVAINTFPYDVKKGAGAAKGVKAAAKAEAADGAVTAAIVDALKAYAALPKNSGTTQTRVDFQKGFGMSLFTYKPNGVKLDAKVVKAANEAVKTDALAELAQLAEFGFDNDENTVTFL